MNTANTQTQQSTMSNVTQNIAQVNVMLFGSFSWDNTWFSKLIHISEENTVQTQHTVKYPGSMHTHCNMGEHTETHSQSDPLAHAVDVEHGHSWWNPVQHIFLLSHGNYYGLTVNNKSQIFTGIQCLCFYHVHCDERSHYFILMPLWILCSLQYYRGELYFIFPESAKRKSDFSTTLVHF